MRIVGIACLASLALALAAAALAQQAPARSSPQMPIKPPEDEAERVVVSVTPIPDVGEGAPDFSPADILALRTMTATETERARADYQTCTGQATLPMGGRRPRNITAGGLLVEKAEAVTRVEQKINKAVEASKAAEAARQGAAAGMVTKDIVDKTELTRQEAVNALLKARRDLVEADAALADYQEIKLAGRTPDRAELDGRSVQRRKLGWGDGIATPDAPKGFAVAITGAEEFSDPKAGRFLRIKGEMTYSGKQPGYMPAITLAAFDDRGWLLDQRTGYLNSVGSPGVATMLMRVMGSRAPRFQMKDGEKQNFVFDLKPAPERADRVSVVFASKGEPPRTASIAMACKATGGDRSGRDRRSADEDDGASGFPARN